MRGTQTANETQHQWPATASTATVWMWDSMDSAIGLLTGMPSTKQCTSNNVTSGEAPHLSMRMASSMKSGPPSTSEACWAA
jgi:hypothetical protein